MLGIDVADETFCNYCKYLYWICQTWIGFYICSLYPWDLSLIWNTLVGCWQPSVLPLLLTEPCCSCCARRSAWMVSSTHFAICKHSASDVVVLISLINWSCTRLCWLWIRNKNFETSSWLVKLHSLARCLMHYMNSIWFLQLLECRDPKLYQAKMVPKKAVNSPGMHPRHPPVCLCFCHPPK